jgi:hypothetical protein
MFGDWFTPDELYAFMKVRFGRAPDARPSAAHDDIALLTWDTFDRVLASRRTVDVMTVSQGRLVAALRPRCAQDVKRLMRLAPGISTVVRQSERHDRALLALASSFSDALPGEVHIQLYATPAGTNSFGWHYDFEDVFILQTQGVKDYYFRDNTVARHTRLGEALDFSLIKSETSPLMTARLVAGDWLYLPRRYWHLVKCVEDSLSISVGVMPLEVFRDALRVPAGWQGLRAQHRGIP